MYLIMILLGIAVWFAVAGFPPVMLHQRWGMKPFLFIGIPYAAAVLAAPFWDYFFMLPAINSAYERLAVNKVYKKSDAKSILYVAIVDGKIGVGGPGYPEAILSGKLEFVDGYINEFVPNSAHGKRLFVRFTRQPKESEHCRKRHYFDYKNVQYCVAYDEIEKSTADVRIEVGTIRVTPWGRFPDKSYEYRFWRAIDVVSGDKLSELVHNFIWRPDICYWAADCRYIVDREESVSAQFDNVKSAVSFLVN